MTIDTSREAVERLLDGVTPGPWEWDGQVWDYDHDAEAPWLMDDFGNRILWGEVECDEANARFIAAARELVPALLARAEAAEARADAAERDRNEADNALVDRYRHPQSGRFSFPTDVAAIVRRLDAAEAALAAERETVARLVEALKIETEAKLDAISTLDAWFDRRKLGHEAVDQAVVDAASGYLRTSRVGGMKQEESDLILGVIQDMACLGLFADLFARAALTQKDRTDG